MAAATYPVKWVVAPRVGVCSNRHRGNSVCLRANHAPLRNREAFVCMDDCEIFAAHELHAFCHPVGSTYEPPHAACTIHLCLHLFLSASPHSRAWLGRSVSLPKFLQEPGNMACCCSTALFSALFVCSHFLPVKLCTLECIMERLRKKQMRYIPFHAPGYVPSCVAVSFASPTRVLLHTTPLVGGDQNNGFALGPPTSASRTSVPTSAASTAPCSPDVTTLRIADAPRLTSAMSGDCMLHGGM